MRDRPWDRRYFIAGIGVAVVMFGIFGLTGWAPSNHRLLSIPLPTAFAFVVAGAAVLCELNKALRGRGRIVLGAVLLLLAGSRLLHEFSVPVLDAHASSPVSTFVRGMSFHCATAFFLTGVIFALESYSAMTWARRVNRLLLIGLFVLAVYGLSNHLLHLEYFYSWYRHTGMTASTALGVVVLGVGLIPLIHCGDWVKAFQKIPEDRKITIIAGVVLLVITLSTGLTGFIIMAHQIGQTSQDLLESSLKSRISTFKHTVDTAIEVSALHSRRPQLSALMQKLSSGESGVKEVGEINELLREIVRIGDAAAVKLTDSAGRHIAQVGSFNEDFAFKAPLSPAGDIFLYWRNAFVLRARFDVGGSAGRLGVLTLEVPLYGIATGHEGAMPANKSNSLQVCAPGDGGMQCVVMDAKTRTVRMYREADREHALLSAFGKSERAPSQGDHFHGGIIGVYDRVGTSDLVMGLTIHQSDVYAPVRRRFEKMLWLILFIVPAGIIALRWQVTPLVRKLLHEIRERARADEESRLLQNISLAVGAARDMHATMQIVLREVSEAAGWSFGQAWVPRADQSVIECSSAWFGGDTRSTRFREASKALTFRLGQGLPGRVWASGKPEWVRDVSSETVEHFPRVPVARKVGLKSGMAIPILADGKTVAVIEFFMYRTCAEDERMIGLVSSIAAQLGVVIQRKLALEALSESEERYRALIENSVDAIYLFEPETKRIIQANAAMQNMLGYSAEEMRTLTMYDFVAQPHEDIDRFVEGLFTAGAITGIERRWRRRDGTLIDIHVTASRIVQQGRLLGFFSGRDITPQKLAAERLEYMAHYDELTGLANRVLFLDRLKQAMQEARDNERLVAVMFLDLDRFKTINDTLGHQVGDELLRAVAGRLRGCVRRGDTVARLGGDEFILVLADMAESDDVAQLGKKTLESFAQPFQVKGYELYISASIGIALYPKDNEDVDALLKSADSAMYHAKAQGRNNYQCYSADMDAKAYESLLVETKLRQALGRGEFLLHYQPMVSLVTGEIVGMEALLRWNNPELGLVSPAEFIPLAEETGLIVPIGEWAMRQACAQTRMWQQAGYAGMKVSVNVSARQFRQGNLADKVAHILSETGLESKSLVLELTESFLHNTEVALTTLKQLHALGVQLSVDDFGVGYSSLSYLKRFPIDSLKIDRSFIRDITIDADDAAIIKAIVTLAHSLGMRVVGEGVETAEQLNFLCRHECDFMQGFYFSKPLPAAGFVELLKKGRRLRASERYMQVKARSREA